MTLKARFAGLCFPAVALPHRARSWQPALGFPAVLALTTALRNPSRVMQVITTGEPPVTRRARHITTRGSVSWEHDAERQ